MNTLHLDHLFGALADPTRRAIIGMLSDTERSAGDVAKAFDMSRPAVAKHLKILQDNGIVVVRQDGRERFNRLNGPALRPIADWIKHFDRFWDERLGVLKAEIEKSNLKEEIEK